jgi:hypothetical protein
MATQLSTWPLSEIRKPTLNGFDARYLVVMMLVNFGSLLIHYLACCLHCVLVLKSWRPIFFILLLLFRHIMFLLFRVLIKEQILDRAKSGRLLVNSKACSELFMSSNLNSVEHRQSKVLAVVADEVVGGPLGAHIMNSHLACLSKSFVVKSSLSDHEGGPFGPVQLLVHINDIKTFVLSTVS